MDATITLSKLRRPCQRAQAVLADLTKRLARFCLGSEACSYWRIKRSFVMQAFRGNSIKRTESLPRYGRERWASSRRMLVHASLALRIGVLLLGALVIGPGRARSANELPVPTQADAFYDGYRLRDGQIVKRLRMHYATLGSPHRAANGDI